METKNKIFVICGSAYEKRKQLLDGVRQRIIGKATCDYETLVCYCGDGRDSDYVRQIATVPFTKQRLVIFRFFCQLLPAARNVLLTQIDTVLMYNYLLFETDREAFELAKDKSFIADPFFSFLLSKGTMVKASPEARAVTIGDFAQSFEQGDCATASYIVERLYANGAQDDIGPQLIGVLTARLPRARLTMKKIDCLRFIWEADRAIKEKGVSARVAIECLLAKLS